MVEAVKHIFLEHKKNYEMLKKIIIAVMKQKTLRASLGIFWDYIHDFIYLIVFIAFRILTAGNSDIMGVHNIVYLITGIIPWFAINESIGTGVTALLSSKNIIKSLKFPISILPTAHIVAILLKRMPTFLLVFGTCLFYGYGGAFNPLKFAYFIVCMLVFLISYNMLFSAIIAISNDFHQLYMALVRIMIFSLPVVWSFENVSSILWLNILLHINPMAYIVSGFRYAFAINGMPSSLYTLYFWGVVAFLFGLGCLVQHKLRKYYADFM